ncbi:MAG: hypothetical protein JRF02_09695 [Deltaproteobacteria bacterium]|jgi:hypothetical protein|nr:hypothetical protein [Deltaproteobacteria bacterium]
MSKTIRKISAVFLLVILLGVPFLDWRLGAVLWMCAWLVFIFRNLYSGHPWKFGENADQDDEPE